MIGENIKHPLGECYGSTSVGSHGQIVIPVGARRELGIEVGTKLLAFDFFEGRALLLLKTSDLEQLITLITSRVSELEAIASQVSKMASATKGETSKNE